MDSRISSIYLVSLTFMLLGAILFSLPRVLCADSCDW